MLRPAVFRLLGPSPLALWPLGTEVQPLPPKKAMHQLGPPDDQEKLGFECRGWKGTLPPHKQDLYHHDNPTPPPGPLSNQECDHPSPQALSPDWGGGDADTSPTPKPGVWHLGPPAVLETTVRAGGPGLGQDTWV